MFRGLHYEQRNYVRRRLTPRIIVAWSRTIPVCYIEAIIDGAALIKLDIRLLGTGRTYYR
jgi:hypothetical protein